MSNPIGDKSVHTITLTADTSIMADNDVIAATQEISQFFRHKGGCAMIESIVLADADDQATDIELVFLNANGSVGSENATYTATDAVLNTILGTVLLSGSNFSDAVNGQTVTKVDVNLLVQAASDSRSLWIAAVCRSGTPTYTGGAIQVRIGASHY